MSSGLLRPDSLPVVLPTEDRPTQHRGMVITIAVLIVLAGATAGVIHREVWQDVGADVTRLLPASTPLYAHANRPWARIDDALTLDRWRDRAAVNHAAATSGLLADGLPGRLAGVPLAVVRKAALAADAIRVARVPTAAGTATQVFLEVEDPWARGRVMAALSPYLESVDRVLGYDIMALIGTRAWLPWTTETPEARIVVMDSHIVLSVGPADALTELLRARTTGRSQPIARRTGFAEGAAHALARRQTVGWAFIDPPELYDLLATRIPALAGAALRFRVFAAERVRAITARSELTGGDDRLELRLVTEPSVVLRAMEEATRGPVDHALLHRLPLEPVAAISVALSDPREFLSRVALIGRVLGAALGVEGADPIGPTATWPALVDVLASSALVASGGALTGQAVLALHPGKAGPGWVLTVACRDAALAEVQLGQLLESTLVDHGWAVGTVRDGDRGDAEVPLHLLRHTADGRTWAWRRAADLLVFAPDTALLAEACRALPDQRAAAARLALRRALRNLRDDPIVAIGDPTALPTPHPHWLALARSLLAGDFRAAASMSFDDHGIVVRSNLGLLTVLAVIAGSPPPILDELALADIPARCRTAFTSLCAGATTSPLCGTLQPGRRALIERACARLSAPPEDGAAPLQDGAESLRSVE